MLKANPSGDRPRVHESAYVDETAVILGNVLIGRNVFVGPGAVIRADEPGSAISVGDFCNVQDRVVVHALENSSVEVGERTSLSHGCIVHGPCSIGRNCFVGFGSVVFGAELADGAAVKHLAVVEDVKVPADKVVDSSRRVWTCDQVSTLGHVDKKLRSFTRKVVEANQRLREGYRNAKGGIS